jgi:hypothetical protein
MISLTIFKNIYDNKTDKRLDLENFDDLEKFFYKLSLEEKSSKNDAVLISPATYKLNTTRKNINVINWAGWCAIDVDEYTFEGDLKDDLVKKFGDYRYVCYSTASSTIDHPKFRIVFSLSKPVENNDIRKFYFALSEFSGGIADKQTKDFSRMYYIPANYAGAYNFIFSHSGDDINPDELMSKYPLIEKTGNSFFDRLPEEMQKEIVEHRKSKMDNLDFNWTSYHNCPFFPKQLVMEYKSITNTGWYHKMFQIMVATAGNAIKNNYPITSDEISVLCKQLDQETGNWYKNRPLTKEADRAIEYVYKNL